MSRSNKWRLERSFFLGGNGGRQNNKVCKVFIINLNLNHTYSPNCLSGEEGFSRSSRRCGIVCKWPMGEVVGNGVCGLWESPGFSIGP